MIMIMIMIIIIIVLITNYFLGAKLAITPLYPALIVRPKFFCFVWEGGGGGVANGCK